MCSVDPEKFSKGFTLPGISASPVYPITRGGDRPRKGILEWTEGLRVVPQNEKTFPKCRGHTAVNKSTQLAGLPRRVLRARFRTTHLPDPSSVELSRSTDVANYAGVQRSP